MKKFLLTALFFCALCFVSQTAQAQENCTSPGSNCFPATSYSFGTAKAHNHGSSYSVTGYYCGRWLVNDSTNNGGNNAYGNEICVTDMTGSHWYWYDWSTDPDAGEKQQVWRSNYPYQWVTVNVADSDCLLATQAYNPWTGGV